MGELLPIATPGTSGLMPYQIAPKQININNSFVKISMGGLYNSLTLTVSIYDGGDVGLFILSVGLSNKICKCILIGEKRTTRFYIKDKDLYITTDSVANCHYSISPMSLGSQIQTIESIPKQEIDNTFTEIPIISISQ